jgi:hypothetical protein
MPKRETSWHNTWSIGSTTRSTLGSLLGSVHCLTRLDTWFTASSALGSLLGSVHCLAAWLDLPAWSTGSISLLGSLTHRSILGLAQHLVHGSTSLIGYDILGSTLGSLLSSIIVWLDTRLHGLDARHAWLESLLGSIRSTSLLGSTSTLGSLLRTYTWFTAWAQHLVHWLELGSILGTWSNTWLGWTLAVSPIVADVFN